MTATLPGGIALDAYRWQRVTIMSLELGCIDMHVHRLHSPDTGDTTLVAFLGHTKPHSPERRQQINTVAFIAKLGGDVIEPLGRDDVDTDTALRLVAQFRRDPDAKMVMLVV